MAPSTPRPSNYTRCSLARAPRCRGCAPLLDAKHAFDLPRAAPPEAARPPAGGTSNLVLLDTLLRPMKAGDYTIALVTYADGEPFEGSQRRLIDSARAAGVDRLFSWRYSNLSATAWGKTHMAQTNLKSTPGCATCSWKPFIILDALLKLQMGDILVYADSSRYFRRGLDKSVVPLANLLRAEAAGLLEPRRHSVLGFVPGMRLRQRNNVRINWRIGPSTRPHSDSPYTRCDLCDVLLRAGLCERGDEACCDRYLHAPHVQNSFSVWQRNAFSEAFVRQWLALNEDREIVRRCRFGDQSIVAVLAVRWGEALGLRVPYIEAWHAPSCGELYASPIHACPPVRQPYYSLLVRHPSVLFGMAAARHLLGTSSAQMNPHASTSTSSSTSPTSSHNASSSLQPPGTDGHVDERGGGARLHWLLPSEPFPECGMPPSTWPKGVMCTADAVDPTFDSPPIPPLSRPLRAHGKARNRAPLAAAGAQATAAAAELEFLSAIKPPVREAAASQLHRRGHHAHSRGPGVVAQGSAHAPHAACAAGVHVDLRVLGAFRCPDCEPLTPLPAPILPNSSEIRRWLLPSSLAHFSGAEANATARDRKANAARRSTWRRAGKFGGYAVLLVTYADGEPFVKTQQLLIQSARRAGVDRFETWNRSRLMSTEWAAYSRVSRFFATFGRTGRWVWKPYIILDALLKLRPGDVCVYADASQYHRHGFSSPLLPLANWLRADATGMLEHDHQTYGIVPGVRLRHRNSAAVHFNGRNEHADGHTKTKRCDLCDILARLHFCQPSDEACCERYFQAPHVQASYSLWRHSTFALNFVRAWLAACEDLDTMKRCKWGDQSVLSLLVTKMSIEVSLRVAYLALDPLPPTPPAPPPFPGTNIRRSGSHEDRRSGHYLAREGNRLKDFDLLLRRYWSAARARDDASLPTFLLQSDQYPECEAAAQQEPNSQGTAVQIALAACQNGTPAVPWYPVGSRHGLIPA